MGAEKLTQYFLKPNTRSGEHAANDPTGEKRVLVRYYKHIHQERFAISPQQTSVAIPDRLETDVWLSPSHAQKLVNSGEAMICKDKHGSPIVEE